MCDAAVAGASPAQSGAAPFSTEDEEVRQAPSIMEVRVSGPAGRICTLMFEGPWTLQELKARIAESSGIPVVAQRIFHGVHELVDEGESAFERLLRPEAHQDELLLVRRSPDEVA